MSPNPATCLAYAPVIAVVVSLLKRVPWLGKSPKLIAALLSVVVTLWPFLLSGKLPADVLEIVLCISAQLAASVGSYEVLRPALQAVKLDPLPPTNRRRGDGPFPSS